MPEYKLIALDLDGTLLNPDKEVPRYASKRLVELLDDGVIVMLDTGRMTNTVYHYVSQIEKRVAFIAYNGAALAYDGWEILRLIQPEQIRKVAAFCHKHDLYMQTYGQMRIYAEKYCKELLIDPDLKHSEFVKVDDFEKYDGLPTPKILCVRFEDDVDQLLEEMAREFNDLFVTKSNPELIEIQQ